MVDPSRGQLSLSPGETLSPVPHNMEMNSRECIRERQKDQCSLIKTEVNYRTTKTQKVPPTCLKK